MSLVHPVLREGVLGNLLDKEVNEEETGWSRLEPGFNTAVARVQRGPVARFVRRMGPTSLMGFSISAQVFVENI